MIKEEVLLCLIEAGARPLHMLTGRNEADSMRKYVSEVKSGVRILHLGDMFLLSLSGRKPKFSGTKEFGEILGYVHPADSHELLLLSRTAKWFVGGHHVFSEKIAKADVGLVNRKRELMHEKLSQFLQDPVDVRFEISITKKQQRAAHVPDVSSTWNAHQTHVRDTSAARETHIRHMCGANTNGDTNTNGGYPVVTFGENGHQCPLRPANQMEHAHTHQYPVHQHQHSQCQHRQHHQHHVHQLQHTNMCQCGMGNLVALAQNAGVPIIVYGQTCMHAPVPHVPTN